MVWVPSILSSLPREEPHLRITQLLRRLNAPAKEPTTPPTDRELRDLVERLQAENARLRAGAPPESVQAELHRAREAVSMLQAALEAHRRNELDLEDPQLEERLDALTREREALAKKLSDERTRRMALEAQLVTKKNGQGRRRTMGNGVLPLILENASTPTGLEAARPAKVLLASLTGPDRRSVVSSWPNLTIGADAGSTLALNDELVSRHHAELTYTRESYELADVGSTNGTALLFRGSREIRFQVGNSVVCARLLAA